jgi:hypothetical protein
MIRVVHPGSGSRILIFLPIPDPGVKEAPDPGYGSATLKKTKKISPLLPNYQLMVRIDCTFNKFKFVMYKANYENLL